MGHIIFVEYLHPGGIANTGVHSTSFVLELELHQTQVFALLVNEFLWSCLFNFLCVLEYCLNDLFIVLQSLFGKSDVN